MSITPWPQGMTGQQIQFTLQQPGVPAGTAAKATPLTGATLSIKIRNNALPPADPNYERAATGTITPTDAANGLVSYTPSAADVGTVGDYALVFIADFGASGKLIWPPARWVITPS